MRLATVRMPVGLRAVRIDDEHAVEIEDAGDVGALLADPDWRTRAMSARGPRHDVVGLDYAPVIPRPDKIICVGLNYRSHILEMGRGLPEHPTLFTKFAAALIGAHDPIILPSVSDQVDWEAELAVVIGEPTRAAPVEDAHRSIAGYAVLNDVTVRDWQRHTTQWTAGKTFEATTPFGPWLVTQDDPAVVGRDGFAISCEVDGDQVQAASTNDLVFDASALIAYASTIVTLLPGDVIATGTPGGVGYARRPPRYLGPGSRVVTNVEGLGSCVNVCTT
jgi:acylpyruvate hydrolase